MFFNSLASGGFLHAPVAGARGAGSGFLLEIARPPVPRVGQ
jgi:hypothetical protein